jgi:hypothetical protein
MRPAVIVVVTPRLDGPPQRVSGTPYSDDLEWAATKSLDKEMRLVYREYLPEEFPRLWIRNAACAKVC